MSSLPPCFFLIFLLPDDSFSFENSFTRPCVKDYNLETSPANRSISKTPASNKIINNATIVVSYFHPLPYICCYLPTMRSLPWIFTQAPASKGLISVSSLCFPLVLFHFQTKATPCNWYFQNSQQDINSNAFCLPYGVSVVCWLNPIVCVNLNAVCCWSTHWCVNHTFLCHWWNTRCINPVIFHFQNHQKVNQR